MPPSFLFVDAGSLRGAFRGQFFCEPKNLVPSRRREPCIEPTKERFDETFIFDTCAIRASHHSFTIAFSAGEYDTALLRASAKGTAAYTADEEMLSDCLPAFFEGGAHRLHRPPHILRHDRPFGAAEGVLLAKRYDSPFARQVIDDFCLVRPQYPAVERICEDLTNTAFAE